MLAREMIPKITTALMFLLFIAFKDEDSST